VHLSHPHHPSHGVPSTLKSVSAGPSNELTSPPASAVYFHCPVALLYSRPLSFTGGAMIITIDGEFPTLNEYIQIERGNKFAAASTKKKYTDFVRLSCIGVLPVEIYPVCIYVTWTRSDSRTDPDNVSFAIKFILDGLVKAHVLRGDTSKDIEEIHHFFKVGDPSVRISIQRE